MTPEAFRDVAIAAIERQIAAGSRLIHMAWGRAGDPGCPVECGCALTLVAQDMDPDRARAMVAGTLSDCAVIQLSADAIGLSWDQANCFMDGFDNDAYPNMGVWYAAGVAIAWRFKGAS